MIVAVTGTGTGVGKTTVAIALVRALAACGLRVGAFKPVETGGDEDGRALARASGADAGPGVGLRTPVAPNVAARLEGVVLDPAALRREAVERAARVDVLVVEPPGGLYSPLTDELTAADWLRDLEPARLLLVAPNRLGVLHDVEACRRALRADGLAMDAVVLTGGSAADPAVATNDRELAARHAVLRMRTPGDVADLQAFAEEMRSRR
ncbi:MAG: dethiobiotin synthase [Deltaproteobacteria bacterium]|nr:dethiobiotin synthase [Deltaproteobacteria bacterium]